MRPIRCPVVAARFALATFVMLDEVITAVRPEPRLQEFALLYAWTTCLMKINPRIHRSLHAVCQVDAVP